MEVFLSENARWVRFFPSSHYIHSLTHTKHTPLFVFFLLLMPGQPEHFLLFIFSRESSSHRICIKLLNRIRGWKMSDLGEKRWHYTKV